MKVIERVSDIDGGHRGGVVTIGNFDGVHLGHQEILGAAKKAAQERQTPLLAITFEPHPVTVLKPDKSPAVLTPLSLKCHYLAQAGVDCLIVLKSTPELLGLSAEDFVDRYLEKAIAPAVVIEGHDFNFGRARSGNIEKLRQLGAEKGFEVCIVEPRKIELSTGQSIRVSSTVIRDLLEGGDVADTARALGRAYRLIGKVIPGHGKGKQLGFPTANLERTEQVVPAHGVYAGRVEIGRSVEEVCQKRDAIPAALSIGHAPTVAADRPQLIEAHLLIDNVGNLIGKSLAMDFIQHLRPQQKFDSVEHLASQIANDCKNAKQVLAAHGGI